MRLAAAAVAEAGLQWRPVGGGGGSDANVFNLKGRPAVNLAAGFEHVHSPQESMSLLHLQQTYQLVHALVRLAGASPALAGGVSLKAPAGGSRSHTPPDPAIAEFLDCLRYERGMSANTVTAYDRDLARYAAFLDEARRDGGGRVGGGRAGVLRRERRGRRRRERRAPHGQSARLLRVSRARGRA